MGGGGEKIWNWCVPSWACKQAIACAIRENICKSVDAESLCTVEKSEEHESRTCGSRRRRVSSINPHARTTEKGKCLTQLLNPQLTITGTGRNRKGRRFVTHPGAYVDDTRMSERAWTSPDVKTVFSSHRSPVTYQNNNHCHRLRRKVFLSDGGRGRGRWRQSCGGNYAAVMASVPGESLMSLLKSTIENWFPRKRGGAVVHVGEGQQRWACLCCCCCHALLWQGKRRTPIFPASR